VATLFVVDTGCFYSNVWIGLYITTLSETVESTLD